MKIEMESSGGRQAPQGGQDYHAPPPVSTLALRAHARMGTWALAGHTATALKKLFPNPNCSNMLNFY